MSGSGTIEVLTGALARALAPLEQWMSPDAITELFAELGLQFPADLPTHPGFANAVSAVKSTAAQLPPLVDTLSAHIASNSSAATIMADGVAVITKVATLLSQLNDVNNQLASLGNAFPGIAAADISAFASALPKNLLEWILVRYLESLSSVTATALALTGVIDRHLDPGVSGNPAKPPFEVRRLRLDRISDLLKSPTAYLQNLYGWGAPGFNGAFLFQQIAEAAGFVGLPAVFTPSGGPGTPSADLLFLQFQPDTSSSPPGVRIDLRVPIQQNFHSSTSLQPGWTLDLAANAKLDSGLVGHIKPPTSFTLTPPSGTLSGDAHARISAVPVAPAASLQILGIAGGFSLEAASIGGGVGATLNWDGTAATVDPLIDLSITGGKAIIDFSHADGFIATVTSGVHAEAGFDLKITWQPDTGIHIDGGAQFDLTLPVHLDLGPISIETLYLSAGADAASLPLEISVALGVSLGPFQASVDRVGIQAVLRFQKGNLGPVDLQIKPKPPNGIGISIDAGVIAGGGYISFDPAKGEYAGVLDLSLVDIVQVKVISILDTILPDGSSGYSFLLIITFDLPPIQLGFGFTLNGVGGVAGVNRTMSIDALHAGLRAHTLDSVMFPPDPVQNASQIISNVRSFFPPADGRYVFGPMVELGWGTPTLITLSLGVILELPDPVRLAILGLIDVGLPTKDVPLIDLHIDVLGTYDSGTKSLSIDGSLYDSHVLIYSVAGSLAMRLNMGSDPNFIFSLGGFNPHFNTAGLDIPPMKRLSVSIGDGDNPRISSNSYFAVTSNSLQFGANTELYAEAGGFSVHGYLGFDVLIIYSPFSFEFDFNAGFDVSFEGHSLCGISVDGMLSGPHPWHVRGHAEFHILFVSVGKTIDLSWGDSTPAVLPQRPVIPDLLAALENPGNWSTALPDGATQAVTLLPFKPDGKTLRVHPMGALSVREKVVPLDLTITRYGNGTPSDGTIFAIGGVTINGQGENQQTFQDYFAPGQFLTLSDADKLSQPSFEKYDAGIQIGSDAVQTGADSPRNVSYEERYIDEPDGFSRLARIYAMPANIHLSLVTLGAGFASSLKNTGLAKYRTGPAAAAVVSQDPSYVIAGVEDLAIRHDIASAQGTTYFAARAALQSHLAAHPEDAANLQILPVHEAAA